MSVYSGFATRQQEKKYNEYLQTLLSSLLKRLLKFYAGQSCDQHKFRQLLETICNRMFVLEQGKFMNPKYSALLTNTLHKMDFLMEKNFPHTQDQALNHTFLELEESKDKMSTLNQSDYKNNFARFRRNSQSNASVNQFASAPSRKNRTLQANSPSVNQISYQNAESPQERRQKSVSGSKILRERSEMFRGREEYELAKELLRMPKLQSFIPRKGEVSPRQYLKQSIFRRQKGDYVSIRKRPKMARLVT